MKKFKKSAKFALQVLLGMLAITLAWFSIHRIQANSRALQTIEIPLITEKEISGEILRIGAYNIAHGRGGKLGESNWTSTTRQQAEAHLTKIADQIKAANLDVIVLNEIDFDANWSGGFDQAKFIAERSGYRYVVTLANIDIDLPFFDLRFGNAILSKIPFTNVNSIELPPVKWWEPILAGKKNALEATIDWNGKAISFIAIHIETRSKETRIGSVEALTNRIHNSDTPFVLLGDFNSQRTDTGETAVDILLDQNGFKTDLTHSHWKTFPSQSPDRGIDWILVDPSLNLQETQAIPSDLSDHLMVTGSISFPSKIRK